MTGAEVEAKVGKDLLERIRVYQHDAHDLQGLANLGTTEHGTEVWVNKLLLEFDHVVALGTSPPTGWRASPAEPRWSSPASPGWSPRDRPTG